MKVYKYKQRVKIRKAQRKLHACLRALWRYLQLMPFPHLPCSVDPSPQPPSGPTFFFFFLKNINLKESIAQHAQHKVHALKPQVTSI